MAKFKRLTGFAHSKAFEIRKVLLEELRKKAKEVFPPKDRDLVL